MPKYLIKVSYTSQGAQGVLSDGGSARVKQAKSVVEAVGGKIESIYFAFGGTDVYVIADCPDNAAVAAASLVVNSTGALSGETVVLITPEEMDAAAKKGSEVAKHYRPPGG